MGFLLFPVLQRPQLPLLVSNSSCVSLPGDPCGSLEGSLERVLLSGGLILDSVMQQYSEPSLTLSLFPAHIDVNAEDGQWESPANNLPCLINDFPCFITYTVYVQCIPYISAAWLPSL